ncbi:MAG: DNA methyltransferase [Candidatus Hodarchaeales archaeon]
MGLENSSSVSEFLLNFIYKENLDQYIQTNSDKKTRIEYFNYDNQKFPLFINEFWTSKQRQASSLHEISYRACFKAQLPRFFIRLLTKPGDTVYDPFSGRGTTVIEAGLLQRNIISNDINPLSKILAKPRFFIPSLNEIKQRLGEIEFSYEAKADIDLSMFYHSKTESEIVSLRQYFLEKDDNDYIDDWIRMVATNRLTGHSKGFFSVYTLPPNQAVSQESQIKINLKRNQSPDYRDVKKLVIKKSQSLLRNITPDQKSDLKKVGLKGLFLTEDARFTRQIKSSSVQLIVTSPPFLNVVQYSKDNWLRCWFNGIDAKEIEKKITMSKKLEDWTKVMEEIFKEFYRIIRPEGWVAFEVGEIKGGKIKLDEYVIPIGLNAGFDCEGVVINMQEFTKTANIWGINNNLKGTNTNRIVLFQKR